MKFEARCFRHAGDRERASGTHPQRAGYGSFPAFSELDGNGWILQEIAVRAPGRWPHRRST